VACNVLYITMNVVYVHVCHRTSLWSSGPGMRTICVHPVFLLLASITLVLIRYDNYVGGSIASGAAMDLTDILPHDPLAAWTDFPPVIRSDR
jgi:hypothetical protein